METTASPQHPLVVILGPTASGKTSLSIALARRFGGEIVNCDSVAIYRELEIGTAKPDGLERSLAPHHLLDIALPTQGFTAGEYARMARSVLGEIASRGALPIVVGGTGLYLRALLEGLFPGPQRSDELRERLRHRERQKGSVHLHRVLWRLDPKSASNIHPNDAPKIIRAIEVCLAAKRPMSELLQQQARDPLLGFRILRLGLDPAREALYSRINDRARQMFERGLVEETRNLLARYGGPDVAPPLGSLGYKQATAFLNGGLTLEQAVTAAQQGHRNYAKRQMTWFRREPDVHWLRGFGNDAEVANESIALVESFVTA
ncbi:MAG TPA: tRNA (adenosine(37)-N6)-dimethylallyltransferase MiaA [Clostridia bacterium]|nr:tRNA (adenosine(37)-N6)-dimethylallyltransferase MiaA [Clostridia bacterium]